ncbi:MAG: pitrilysin family protein [Candidatus Paceibacterota bacterium]
MVYKTRKLDNGLTIIGIPLKDSKTTTVLTLVGVGSRYESDNEQGLSHFLEHMMFKGTKKRPNAKIIAQELDGLGASYNAFTSYEYTGYWVKVRNQKKYIALDVISDIFQNSLLETSDIQVERGAIIEELNMYMDMPTRQIHSDFQTLLYGSETPLGRSIIGTKESINSFTRPDFVDYVSNKYVASNTYIIIAGEVDTNMLDKVEASFYNVRQAISPKKSIIQINQNTPKINIRNKKTDQTHLMLGFHIPSIHTQDRYIASIASTILGGYMSSRLFTEIREKRGLSYYIRADSHHFDDTGVYSINTGVQNTKVVETLNLILKELKTMKSYPVSDKELNIAKENIQGQTVMGFESSDEIAAIIGMNELLLNENFDLDHEMEQYQSITKQQILEFMQKYTLAEHLNLALIGNIPASDNTKLEQILSSL